MMYTAGGEVIVRIDLCDLGHLAHQEAVVTGKVKVGGAEVFPGHDADQVTGLCEEKV